MNVGKREDIDLLEQMYKLMCIFNYVALRMSKTLLHLSVSFGHSECKRLNNNSLKHLFFGAA